MLRKLKLKPKLFSLSICSLCFPKTFPTEVWIRTSQASGCNPNALQTQFGSLLPGSVNHKIISEQTGRKSAKVFKEGEGMGEKEGIEMLNSNIGGNKSTSHATNSVSNHPQEREHYDTISSQPTDGSSYGRQYDVATARVNDGTESVRAIVISHLFQRISVQIIKAQVAVEN